MRLTFARALALILVLASTRTASAAGPLDQPLHRAQRAGLPLEVLKNKAAEGHAKRISEKRIARVLDRLVDYMLEARTWLQRHKARRRVPAGLLRAMAEARLAGVGRQALHQLVPRNSRARRAQRVDALVDLRLRGYPPGSSLELVRRTPARQLPQLGRIADRVRRSTGLSHAEVADDLVRGLRSTRSIAKAASRASSRAHGRGPKAVPPGKLRGKAHGPKPGRGRGRGKR